MFPANRKRGWRRYNDTSITSITDKKMHECAAVNGYLFFYTHDAYFSGYQTCGISYL